MAGYVRGLALEKDPFSRVIHSQNDDLAWLQNSLFCEVSVKI